MKEIKIVSIETSKIKPYPNNPRFNDNAVPYLAESIRQFGFKVPIVIDKNNVIITGHTRWKAAQMLGMEKMPCIRADDLTEEQIKAFRLADNKVGEVATWDYDKLDIELADLDIDMGVFDFTVDGIEDAPIDDLTEEDDEGYYGDERERTNKAYNLDLIDWDNLTNDFWQMPIIKNDGYIPKDLVGFNYAKTYEDKSATIHFYVDDYQFERIWNKPEAYVNILGQYECILSPDFSLYMDMPMAMKIWNIYRSRQIGAYYQNMGIKVIPTLSWAEAETFQFCFQGIPKGSIVSVSTVGVKEDKEALKIWTSGMDEMIKQIEPSTIINYGGKLDYDYGGIDTKFFTNKVTDNWKGKESDV